MLLDVMLQFGKILIGFASVITMPSGTVKNAWRGHRPLYYQIFKEWV
jgi:hypothetical protein